MSYYEIGYTALIVKMLDARDGHARGNRKRDAGAGTPRRTGADAGGVPTLFADARREA